MQVNAEIWVQAISLRSVLLRVAKHKQSVIDQSRTEAYWLHHKLAHDLSKIVCAFESYLTTAD